MNEIEELKAKVEQEKMERAAKMLDVLEAGLEKYNCSLVSIPQITAEGKIIASVTLVAND